MPHAVPTREPFDRQLHDVPHGTRSYMTKKGGDKIVLVRNSPLPLEHAAQVLCCASAPATIANAITAVLK